MLRWPAFRVLHDLSKLIVRLALPVTSALVLVMVSGGSSFGFFTPVSLGLPHPFPMVLRWLLSLHPPLKHRQSPGLSCPASMIRALRVTPEPSLWHPCPPPLTRWLHRNASAALKLTKASFVHELLFFIFHSHGLSLLTLSVEGLTFLKVLQSGNMFVFLHEGL